MRPTSVVLCCALRRAGVLPDCLPTGCPSQQALFEALLPLYVRRIVNVISRHVRPQLLEAGCSLGVTHARVSGEAVCGIVVPAVPASPMLRLCLRTHRHRYWSSRDVSRVVSTSMRCGPATAAPLGRAQQLQHGCIQFGPL